MHNDSEECLSFAGARYGLYVVRFLVWLGLAISYAHGPNSLRYSPPALRWRICVSAQMAILPAKESGSPFQDILGIANNMQKE